MWQSLVGSLDRKDIEKVKTTTKTKNNNWKLVIFQELCDCFHRKKGAAFPISIFLRLIKNISISLQVLLKSCQLFFLCNVKNSIQITYKFGHNSIWSLLIITKDKTRRKENSWAAEQGSFSVVVQLKKHGWFSFQFLLTIFPIPFNYFKHFS